MITISHPDPVGSRGGEGADIHVNAEGNLALTGDPGTIIPAGSRARTGDNAVFALDERVIIPESGEAVATMRSQELGHIPAPAGTLTHMVEAITGWTGINNLADAQPGRNAETDREYRRRYALEVAHNGRDGGRAHIHAVAGDHGL